MTPQEQERLRLDRRDAEGPDLDPLLDCRRIIALAQRLASQQVNGPRPADAPPTASELA